MNNAMRLKFTPLAKAFAEAKYSLAAVAEQVRGEMSEFLHDRQKEDPDYDIEKWKGFHTICMPNQSYWDDNLFFVTPECDKAGFFILVDTSTVEVSSKPLDKGHFKGYALHIPQADSDDIEDDQLIEVK